MKSKDANDGSEQALLDELKALDEHLRQHVCTHLNCQKEHIIYIVLLFENSN